MEQIGIRELRQHASKWINKVRAGASIEITDRGCPVAHLVPIHSTDPDRDALAAAGVLAPAPAPRPTFDADALIAGADLTVILDEQRSDR
jgi:prevent-host-death family protein